MDMRLALISLAPFAAAAATPAAAATTIDMGSYSGGDRISTAGDVALGVGRYRFTLKVTGSVQGVDAYAIKTLNTDFYCTDPADPGASEFSCGGDDVPEESQLLQTAARTFQATVIALPPRTYLSPGGFITRTVDSDGCCGYLLDFDALTAGKYILSVTALPEPGSWTMLIGGFGMVGAALRRRRVARGIVATLA